MRDFYAIAVTIKGKFSQNETVSYKLYKNNDIVCTLYSAVLNDVKVSKSIIKGMDQENIVAEQTAGNTLESKTSASGGDENKKIIQIDSEKQAKEIGGPKGLEPTRYGDWEKRGRCVDF